MLRIEYVYWLCGALLAACALHDLRARRYAAASFWGILAAIFLGGDAVAAAAAHGDAGAGPNGGSPGIGGGGIDG